MSWMRLRRWAPQSQHQLLKQHFARQRPRCRPWYSRELCLRLERDPKDFLDLKPNPTSRTLLMWVNLALQQGAQKCDGFWFIHILSYKFNPIRSQLETVLGLWLVDVCMKECELIKIGHTFGLLALKTVHYLINIFVNKQPNNNHSIKTLW